MSGCWTRPGRGRWLVVLGIAALACGGCGRKVYPVQGSVKYAGGRPIAPLVGGTVEFEPAEEEARTTVGNARGDIQPDGTFRLSTFNLGLGAIEGPHRAIVIPPAPKDSDGGRPPAVHPRFQRYETSGFQFNVTRDKEKNTFVLEVTAPGRISKPRPGRGWPGNTRSAQAPSVRARD